MAEYPTNSDVNLALHDHIVGVIIPKMEARRKRTETLSEDQIHEKLYHDKFSQKPGEEFELQAEIRRDIDGVDGQLASEIADRIYYSSYPKCSEKDLRVVLDWLFILGISLSTAQEFCIVKYETRIKHGDEPNYKEIENDVLDKYIDRYHPYLKTIWQNQS